MLYVAFDLKQLITFIFVCLFLCQCNKKKLTSDFSVGVILFNEFDTSILNVIQPSIEKFYHCKVSYLASIPLPEYAYYAPRQRYRADSLLSFLKEFKKGNNLILGLTEKDISTSKNGFRDWGVFGLGYCPGAACVISTYRLNRHSNMKDFNQRLLNVCLHEIGHNLGLPHCTIDTCLMKDAKGKIESIEGANKQLCPDCKLKL